MGVAEELQQLEEWLLRSEVRSDGQQVAELLCEEFLEYGASGRVFTKAEIVTELGAEIPVELSLREFRCEAIAEGVALVTYRSVRKTNGSELESLRSSLWVQREGRWQMRFHQGTRAAVESSPAAGAPTSD